MFLEGKKPHFAVIAGCIFYGMNGLFIDRIHGMSIAPIIFYRLFFGLLFLFIYSCQRKNLGPEIKEKKGEPSLSERDLSKIFFSSHKAKTFSSLSLMDSAMIGSNI